MSLPGKSWRIASSPASFGTCMRFLTVEIASRRVTSHQGTHVCIGCHGGSIDLQYIPSSFTGFPLERTLLWGGSHIDVSSLFRREHLKCSPNKIALYLFQLLLREFYIFLYAQNVVNNVRCTLFRMP
ncbi:hypothetical protein XU18_3303 [Perkinsela sp. CCAP 1560/4]|nr:hypothetical protein XU18_3303 [Perkinsela sp. CCAP 1560/4]|eukprot:KNH05686.1 hypothetical protein XU18_3303 [Perkinsela sp. CCAP 1560/4]